MSTTKICKVFIFLMLWSFLLGPVQGSAYGYKTAILDTPSDFGSWGTWNSIGNFLVSSHYQVYILNWQGHGGRTDIGKRFIAYIQQAEAQGKRIVIKMTGNSYSMHALVPCYASQIINKNNQFLMYHADGYDNVRTTKSKSTINQQLNMCVSAGILSSGKVDKLWNGYEVYVDNYKTWYYRDPRPIG